MTNKKEQNAKKVDKIDSSEKKISGQTKGSKESGKDKGSGKEIDELVKNNGNIRFMIIELDILRGSSGSNFKTLVDAKDVKEAIMTFFKRFPDHNSHIIVVPNDQVTEHTGYMQPKVIIKVDKKRPLIVSE